MKTPTATISAVLAILMLATFSPAGSAACACQVLRMKIQRIEAKLAYGSETHTLNEKEVERYREKLTEYIEEARSSKSDSRYQEKMLVDVTHLSVKIGRKIKKRLESNEKLELSRSNQESKSI